MRLLLLTVITANEISSTAILHSSNSQTPMSALGQKQTLDRRPLMSALPGPMTDAVAGVDGRRPGLRAHIGVPGARARSDRGGERLAVRVGAREAAQVAALPEPACA